MVGSSSLVAWIEAAMPMLCIQWGVVWLPLQLALMIYSYLPFFHRFLLRVGFHVAWFSHDTV